jgi:hypothetical protein
VAARTHGIALATETACVVSTAPTCRIKRKAQRFQQYSKRGPWPCTISADTALKQNIAATLQTLRDKIPLWHGSMPQEEADAILKTAFPG